MSFVRVALLFVAPGLLAACGSLPSGPTFWAPTAAAVPVEAPAFTGSTRHAVVPRGCAHWVSDAECSRVHAEGLRMLRATCPQNDKTCASVEVVSARRVSARVTELTVRDATTGKVVKKRVPVTMGPSAAN